MPAPSLSLERVAYIHQWTSSSKFVGAISSVVFSLCLYQFSQSHLIGGEKGLGLFNWIGLEMSKKHECNKWCRSSQLRKGRGNPPLSAPRWCSVQVFPPARSHGGPWVDFCTARRGSELFCFAVCTHASKWLCIWLLSPPCPEIHENGMTKLLNFMLVLIPKIALWSHNK